MVHITVTFHSLLVTWCTTSLTFNNCRLCPHCVYVFCIYLRTNSDLCHLQLKLIGFYNRDEKCLQRGTDWVFKYSGLHFVFKGLMFCLVSNSVFCAQTEIHLKPIAQLLGSRPVLSIINRTMATCFDLCLSFRSLFQALHLIYNRTKLLWVHFRLPQGCKLDPCSSGMLRCVEL